MANDHAARQESNGQMNPDAPEELDNHSFGRSDAPVINTERQGVSNRPGDEEPDSGVDREPGEPQTDDSNE